MSVWQAHTGEDGRTYYYNSVTQESKWEKPDELLTPIERALASSKWKEYTAEGGVKYWHNQDTGESVWDTPEEINSILKSTGDTHEDTQSHDHDQKFSGHDDYSHSISSNGINNNVPSSSSASRDYFKYSSHSKIAPGALQEYPSEQEAVDAFKQMLRQLNLDDSYSWATAMKLSIKDPRYWAIQHPLARKRAFDEFVVEIKHERQEQRRQAREDQLKEMTMALTKYPEIKYYTRWRTVKDKFGAEDPVFASVADPKLRHYAFHLYVKKLRTAYETKQLREREIAIERLDSLFETLGISSDSQWLDVLQTIKSSPKFADDARLGVMPRQDILSAYSSYIRKKDHIANVERQKIKKIQRRQERHVREAFIKLLQSLRQQGHIKVGTKWIEVRPMFENDERYINICGQAGSTPLELFWDMVQDEERSLKLQREQVIDLITAKKFVVNENTPYPEFEEFVKVNWAQHADPISDHSLQTIFRDIQLAEQKRKEEDRYADERRIRRAQDGLRAVIRRLEPPIGVDAVWEDIKPRVADSEEYIRLETEELRKEAFAKYIRRLKEKISEREKEWEREKARDERRRKEPGGSAGSAGSAPPAPGQRDVRSSRYEGGAPPLPTRQDSQPQPYFGNPYYDDRGGMGGGVLDY